MLDKNSVPRRAYHQTNSSAKGPSILMRNPKPSQDCKDLRALNLSLQTHISDVKMNQMAERNMEIWRRLQRTL